MVGWLGGVVNILFVMNPVAGGWSPKDPEGWGGGEEVVVKSTSALSAAGHTVSVLWDGPALTAGAVTYHGPDLGKGAYDAVVYFKCPELATRRLAPVMALWTDQERGFNPDPFDLIATPSAYLGRVFAGLLPRAAEKLVVVPYGYDPKEVEANVPRDPNLVLHAASPDRGLETLLDLWPEVAAARPAARLLAIYGWDLFLKYGGDPALKARIEAKKKALPSVSMGRVPRMQLGRAYASAGVWAYYCTGGEQFGISAIKAQVAGCVPVVKPWGALHETVFSGIKVETQAAFRDALIDVLEPERQAVLRAAIDPSPARSWEWIAEEWTRLLSQAKPVVATSRLVNVPPTPVLAPPPGMRFAEVLTQVVGNWAVRVKPQKFWADPSLPGARSSAPTPADADAVLLAWSIEDGELGADLSIRARGINPGTAVCLVASFGTWRAKDRRRALSRVDLIEMLGKQPEFDLTATSVDSSGGGIYVTTFRYDPTKLARRNVPAALRRQRPRETLSACFMVRDVEPVFLRALESITPFVDEIIVIDTGSIDGTADVVDRFAKSSGIPVTYGPGTSPRWCYDCVREHGIGEFQPGHRVAGFETARNESIARAQGDWCLWLDADEELLEAQPGAVAKYLRRNTFAGYSIPQYHHSTEPNNPGKTDYPVRLFRREPDGEPGLFAYGPLAWPTYHSGQKVRFAGIVHEHPGFPPTYQDGLGPVVILSDVSIAHSGYFIEERRRRRFMRNWPLMCADRQKYPDRRLGTFLWIRDLFHHMRYLLEQNGNRPTAESVSYAEEIVRLYDAHFLSTMDQFSTDCLAYYSAAMGALGRGVEFNLALSWHKPEVGNERVEVTLGGRINSPRDVIKLIEARVGEANRFEGPWL